VHLVDSNVWLALTIDLHVHHQVAVDWFETIADSDSLFFCRSTQQSFLRLLTTSSVFAPYGIPAFSNRSAWDAYDLLLTEGRVAFHAREPVGLAAGWREFSDRSSSSTKLWMDSYLAAFALAGGYQMVTTDSAFAQFEGLDLVLLASAPKSN